MVLRQLRKTVIPHDSVQYDAELFSSGRWLLCPPYFYDIKYEINAWMSVERTPQGNQALEQWKNLHHTLLRLGCWIHYVDPLEDQPDMVFTANAGLVYGKKVVISRFRHTERQGEEPALEKWFSEMGYEVLKLSNKYAFEGEGDALFVGEKLFCGYGFRSDKEVYCEVAELLGIEQKNLLLCELVDTRFYHIDTCFCPLNEKQALCFCGAFSEESQERMRAEVELIEVPEDEAANFACNSVVLGGNIVIPASCEKTYKILSSYGYCCYPVEMGEFLKAGGAAKCLSLRI